MSSNLPAFLETVFVYIASLHFSFLGTPKNVLDVFYILVLFLNIPDNDFFFLMQANTGNKEPLVLKAKHHLCTTRKLKILEIWKHLNVPVSVLRSFRIEPYFRACTLAAITKLRHTVKSIKKNVLHKASILSLVTKGNNIQNISFILHAPLLSQKIVLISIISELG